MIRLDGRRLNELRPIKIYKNLILSASSSNQLCIGSTSVIVAVFNKLNPDKEKKKLELEVDSFDKLCRMETLNTCKVGTDIILKENLNLLYEYDITINIFVIEDDGNLLTVLLNAISQGLKDLQFLKSKEIIFCTIGITKKNKDICIDPSNFEIEFLEQEICYAILYDTFNKKLKFYQILKLLSEKKMKNKKISKNSQKLIIEFGFYLFKVFN